MIKKIPCHVLSECGIKTSSKYSKDPRHKFVSSLGTPDADGVSLAHILCYSCFVLNSASYKNKLCIANIDAKRKKLAERQSMQPIKSAQELMHDVASDVDDATDSDIPPTEYTNATTCN